jgi:hypothetical protein
MATQNPILREDQVASLRKGLLGLVQIMTDDPPALLDHQIYYKAKLLFAEQATVFLTPSYTKYITAEEVARVLAHIIAGCDVARFQCNPAFWSMLLNDLNSFDEFLTSITIAAKFYPHIKCRDDWDKHPEAKKVSKLTADLMQQLIPDY